MTSGAEVIRLEILFPYWIDSYGQFLFDHLLEFSIDSIHYLIPGRSLFKSFGSMGPNIVITIADDQRWNTIHALGNSSIHTPHLDRLCDRGTSYIRAQHGGSSHGAVCAPSRAQLHTGRTLFHTSDSMHALTESSLQRFPNLRMPLPTLGSKLRAVGYDTFAVGKWHNESESFLRSFAAGSAIFFGGMCPHFCVAAQELTTGASEFSPARVRAGHSTEVFSDAAVEFIRSRAADDPNPFFLYVAFTAPHDPRETHHRFRALYRDEPPLPANFLPRHPFLDCSFGRRDEMLAEFPRSASEIQMHLADYYAMISHLDEGIGKIHCALEKMGLIENTIVVHTADHGLAVGSHGLMGKQNLYDHSIRVPLVVAGPGFARGSTDNRLCYQHDLHPTLLAVAGAEDASGDYLNLQSGSVREYSGCTYGTAMRCIRNAEYKLIQYSLPEGGARELFDTQSDPDELANLAEEASLAKIREQLECQLGAYLAMNHDPAVSDFAISSH